MKSQIVTNPIAPKKIQMARYHGGSHSYTANPTASTKTTPHACRNSSPFTRTTVLL